MKETKHLFKSLFDRLPRCGFFDYIYNFSCFWVAHRRLPSENSGLYNDYLFYMKSSSEIERAARQFTSDKRLVKLYVASILGEDRCPRTHDVIFDEVKLGEFSAKVPCVLKPAHLSGSVVFKMPGEKLSNQEHYELASSLKRNLYTETRERNYKNLVPSIIVEEALVNNNWLLDYKIFCFMGIPKIVAVYSGRGARLCASFYDVHWNQLSIGYQLPPIDGDVLKPKSFFSILEAAEKLSSEFESARVDFYEVDGEFYVGEITHIHAQGNARFNSVEDERRFSRVMFG